MGYKGLVFAVSRVRKNLPIGKHHPQPIARHHLTTNDFRVTNLIHHHHHHISDDPTGSTSLSAHLLPYCPICHFVYASILLPYCHLRHDLMDWTSCL